MKKIISISLAILLMYCSLFNVNALNEDIHNSPIPESIQDNRTYLEELYSVMKEPIIIQPQTSSNDHLSSMIIDTPTEFSWKDYNGIDLTTPARSQGQCGSCWAFAALGAIESVINIREGFKDIDIDLSEQYLLSCVPAAGSCGGGRTASPFEFIINTSEEGNFLNGVIFEACLPYEADDSIPCSEKSDNWLDTLIPLSDFGEEWFGPNNANAVDIMKSKIYQNGPIYALMLVDDSFRYFGSIYHRSSDYFHYRSTNADYLNHAILIVGWKDDASIRKGGYWICKNSWGTDWGYDGFFNMEYDSMNIQQYIAWAEYDPDTFDCPIVADAGGFYQGTAGEPLLFDGQRSFDAEDKNLEYIWDFGDGTTGQGVMLSHTYMQPGTYDITLTVTDDNNTSSSDTTIATIDEEFIEFEVSGGFGLTIHIKNILDRSIFDTELFLTIIGSYQNIDHRNEHIGCISSHGTFILTMPIVGAGKGILHIEYENIELTKHFFSVGPFIIINGK